MRLLMPFLIVLSAKLVGGLLLYGWLNMGSSNTYWMTTDRGVEGQNEALTSGIDEDARWLYLFLGWDSAWYLSIATRGYGFSDQSYAFFPGLPLLGSALNGLLQGPARALVAVSVLLGLLWVPVYQLVAEGYLDERTAFCSTLFYAFSPYVFLFTTVVYTEGLFLLSTLAAWYLFKKRGLLAAMLPASIAALSRPPGLLILIPLLAETLQRQRGREGRSRRRELLYLAIPLSSFFLWLLYCRVMFNDWFAPFDRTAWNGMSSLSFLLTGMFSKTGLQPFLNTLEAVPFSFASFIFLLGSPLLIHALLRMDRSLAVYSTVCFAGVLVFGALASSPRFLSFIFPMWLPLASKLSRAKRSGLLMLALCASFYLSALFLWASFLNGAFIS